MKKLLIIAAVIVSVLIGCGPDRKEEGMMDTPEAHYKQGMKFIGEKEWVKAFNEFNLAKSLNPKYAPAYEGFAESYLGENKLPGALQFADEAISKDGKYYRGYLVRGKVYMAMQEYKKARNNFEKAFDLMASAETARWVGYANFRMGEFEDAREWYKKALGIKSNDQETMKMMTELNEIEMALPGMGKSARRIALSGIVTRADIAALFIDELNVEKYFKADPKFGFIAYGDPQSDKKAVVLPDIAADFWARSFVERSVAYGIMEIFPSGNFEPGREITKVEYARYIAGIIMKLSNEKDLITKFVGSPSPYKDVPNSHFAFNDIMICTTRGILETNINGEFGLTDKVPGRNAVLAIKKLKQVLENR